VEYSDKPKITFVWINNIYGQLLCDDPRLMDAAIKRFAVPVENYFFMPAYKAGRWDGKIRFLNYNGTFYLGIYHRLLKYVRNDDLYELVIDPKFEALTNKDTAALKEDFFKITEETLDSGVVPYTHQYRGALKSLYFERGICEHVTSSGKSLTITLTINYLYNKNKDNKILILVPKLDLVEQFVENMTSFGIPPDLIGKYCGYQKDTDEPFIVSTWQSIYKQKEFLKEFTILIVDECLHPSTQISMADGNTKLIKDIEVGDMVKTVNEKTGEIEDKPVVKIHHNISKGNQMYKIHLDNGKSVKITGNHKVKLKSGEWKKAEDLCIGDDILDINTV
jgi:hypothetical protein